MGLHIHNLGGIPANTDRKYFVYVLDYGWKEPLTDTLIQNFTNMARQAADSQSVVVAGIDPIHFANQVFSWHGINGEDGEKVLPAVMVTALHPTYFMRNSSQDHMDPGSDIEDKILLIPLKRVCETTDDVVELIKSIFSDIRGEKNVLSFEIAKEMSKKESGRGADALLLEPNFFGMGIRLPEALKWLSGFRRTQPKTDG